MMYEQLRGRLLRHSFRGSKPGAESFGPSIGSTAGHAHPLGLAPWQAAEPEGVCERVRTAGPWLDAM